MTPALDCPGGRLDDVCGAGQDRNRVAPGRRVVDKFPSRERATAVALEPRVSAVVVVRGAAAANGQAPLDLCLKSAMSEPMIDDLVIIDHGNQPDVSQALRALQADRRDVRVVAAPLGATLAAAANLGARHAIGRWLLFLEPDVVLQRGAVARMAAAGGD